MPCNCVHMCTCVVLVVQGYSQILVRVPELYRGFRELLRTLLYSVYNNEYSFLYLPNAWFDPIDIHLASGCYSLTLHHSY